MFVDFAVGWGAKFVGIAKGGRVSKSLRTSVLVLLTHQAPVVWKLAQVQAASPRCICGPAYDILVLHFKC